MDGDSSDGADGDDEEANSVSQQGLQLVSRVKEYKVRPSF
jgi:hypothetical protein